MTGAVYSGEHLATGVLRWQHHLERQASSGVPGSGLDRNGKGCLQRDGFSQEIISVATPFGNAQHGTDGMAGSGLVWAVYSGMVSIKRPFRWQHQSARFCRDRIG